MHLFSEMFACLLCGLGDRCVHACTNVGCSNVIMFLMTTSQDLFHKKTSVWHSRHLQMKPSPHWLASCMLSFSDPSEYCTLSSLDKHKEISCFKKDNQLANSTILWINLQEPIAYRYSYSYWVYCFYISVNFKC